MPDFDPDTYAAHVLTMTGSTPDELALASSLAVLSELERQGRAEVKAKRKAMRRAKRHAFWWRVVEAFANTSPYAVPYVPPLDD